ncbi:MAG: DUF5723 family protein [Bacteroidota bacterium]|nr:DUF5723 family protein [Bacteroidota bacterium]
MKLKITIFSIMLSLAHFSNGQNMLGVSSSNYAGTNGVISNPSYAADTRHAFYLNLVSGNAYFANNYYIWNSPESPIKFFLSEDSEFKEDYLLASNSDKLSLFNIGADIRGPSVLLKLSPKSGLSINTRGRISLQGDNISSGFIGFFKEGIEQEEYIGKQYKDNTFSLNANVVNELGVTYARTLLEKENHFLKAGFTVKRLVGAYSAHVISKAMDFTVRRDDATLDYSLEIQKITANYGFSTDQIQDVDIEELMNPFNSKSTGKGWGFDFGLTYEHRANVDQYKYKMDGVERLDNRKNKYDYKIGFALLDIGGISYNNPATRSYNINKTDKVVTAEEILNMEDYEEFLNEVLDVSPTSGVKSLRSGLPTALKVDFDYRLAKKLYTNLSVYQNLRGKTSIGMRQNSLVALTPRLETKWFELAVPVSMMNNYQSMALGASVKLGILYVGSDNLNSVIGVGKAHGADIYFGASIPFFKGKKRDNDKDGISNSKDQCKNIAGVWQFKGCPDSDGDGIEDKLDKCPTLAGTAAFSGCPDTDGDGIPDSEDACPEVAGLAALKGCPDADGDLVPDHLDECPEVAGLFEYNGCPDTDGDGIIDSKDECPLFAGLPENKGCPDADGDGVPDHLDECPDVKGLAMYNGCPDRDDDGVPDHLDKCPDVQGLKRYEGCLDRDMDGVPDHLDKCPETYGSVENKGCPLVKVEEVNELAVLNEEEATVLKEAFNNLEFNSGKAVISESSVENMNSLAEILIKKPEFRLLVSGHTDNVGKKDSNLQLSRARANAVKTFLIKAGVSEFQIITEGFGSERPISSNATDAGRKQNRRVELKIIK